MTYYGSQMVVENYNMMGPVKAALESQHATWLPSWGLRASEYTRSPPVHSKRAPLRGYQRLR